MSLTQGATDSTDQAQSTENCQSNEDLPTVEIQETEIRSTNEIQSTEDRLTDDVQPHDGRPTNENQSNESSPTEEVQSIECRQTDRTQRTERSPTDENQSTESLSTCETKPTESPPTTKVRFTESPPTDNNEPTEGLSTNETQPTEHLSTEDQSTDGLLTYDIQSPEDSTFVVFYSRTTLPEHQLHTTAHRHGQLVSTQSETHTATTPPVAQTTTTPDIPQPTTIRRTNAAHSPATASTSGGPVGELNDQGYIKWLKGTRMLQLTSKVLRKVCLVEVTKVHAELQKRCGETCSVRCSRKNISYNKSNKNWSIVCPDNVCSKWFAAVVAMRTKPSTKLAMHNADIWRWMEEPWQLANVFMENPQPQSVDPSETDVSGIQQLMMNCSHFRKVVDTTKVQGVRILMSSSFSTIPVYGHYMCIWGDRAYVCVCKHGSWCVCLCICLYECMCVRMHIGGACVYCVCLSTFGRKHYIFEIRSTLLLLRGFTSKYCRHS